MLGSGYHNCYSPEGIRGIENVAPGVGRKDSMFYISQKSRRKGGEATETHEKSK